MSTRPLPPAPVERTVAEILLAHGFVTEEALADAEAEQRATAQPIGQILVQRGAITRLELASALAEYWSGSTDSIELTPVPAPDIPPPPRHDVEDALYAVRLQEAVADLARRVQAIQAPEELERRLAGLTATIEAERARGEELAGTVAALTEGLDGVTTGVEEAFASLQGGTAELAAELGRVDRSVRELADRPSPEAGPDVARIADLQRLAATVEELASRPPVDDEARHRIGDISARLETLVDGAALDDLRAALEAVEGRPAADPQLERRLVFVETHAGEARPELEAHAAALDGIARTLAELAERPTGEPDVAARLAQLEEALAARVAENEALLGRADELAAHLTAAREEVGAVRGPIDGLLEAVAALQAPTGLDERVEELAASIAALEQRAGLPDPDVADRLAQVLARIDALEAAQAAEATAHQELAGASARTEAEVAGVIERVHGGIDDLRGEIETLRAARGVVADEIATRVEGLAGQLAGLPGSSALEDLAARVVAIEEARAASAAELEALRSGATPADVTQALAARLEALEGALAAGLVTPGLLEERLQGLRTALTPEPQQPDTYDDLVIATEALMARFKEVSAQLAEHVASTAARETADASTLAELAAAVERLERETVSRPEAEAPAAVSDDRIEPLEARLGALEAALEAGLAAPLAEAPGTPELTGSPVGVEDELERIRMAIERLRLHLGEQDQTLAELVRNRSATRRENDLAARVAEPAAGGSRARAANGNGHAAVGAPTSSAEMRALADRLEEAEEAAAAEREKLLTRLERMASSIDWRLQRLESGEATPTE